MNTCCDLVGVVRERAAVRGATSDRERHAALLRAAARAQLQRAAHASPRAARVAELEPARVGDVEQVLDDAGRGARSRSRMNSRFSAGGPSWPERPRQVLDAGGDAGERVADLVGDARGEAPERGEAVERARVLLGALERRQVDERGDRAVDVAALVAQQRGGEAHRQRRAVAGPQQGLLAQHLAPVLERRRASSASPSAPNSAPNGWPEHLGLGEAEQLLGGAVEGQDLRPSCSTATSALAMLSSTWSRKRSLRRRSW